MYHVNLKGIQVGVPYLTLWGYAVGILTYCCILLVVFFLLKKYDLNRKNIMSVTLFSSCGHFLGGLGAYWYAVNKGADSIFYFSHASTHANGFGYFFAFLALGYLKKIIFGQSFLAAFLFFSAFGFLGSVFLFLTYVVLLERVMDKNEPDIKRKLTYFPALILLCWPSYFFWSAQLIKDSFSFLFVSVLLLTVSKKTRSFSDIIWFILAAFLAFMVRPYLLVVISFSASLYFLLQSNAKMHIKIVITLLLFGSIPATLGIMSQFTQIGFSSYAEVANYSLRQQQYMSIGSSIPMPTHNPYLLPLFLPYLIIVNLFLPIIIGGGGLMGLLSSCENAYFLILVIGFIKNSVFFNVIRKKIPIVSFLVLYFLFGMALLGLINTNLGLAMREKMMYVPGLLIVILLTHSYKKYLLMQRMKNAIVQDLAKQKRGDLCAE